MLECFLHVGHRTYQHGISAVPWETSRISSLLSAGDVSRGGMSATQRQKFHTDDVKSVWNPVISADWMMK